MTRRALRAAGALTLLPLAGLLAALNLPSAHATGFHTTTRRTPPIVIVHTTRDPDQQRTTLAIAHHYVVINGVLPQAAQTQRLTLQTSPRGQQRLCYQRTCYPVLARIDALTPTPQQAEAR